MSFPFSMGFIMVLQCPSFAMALGCLRLAIFLCDFFKRLTNNIFKNNFDGKRRIFGVMLVSTPLVAK